MPSPFPGMAPWLEDPAIWTGFHHSLVVEISHAITATLPKQFFADIGVRRYRCHAI